MESVKSNENINEFLRYLVVGGIAFFVDFLVLYIFKEFILKSFYNAVYISNALGFIAGLAVNYALSLCYVFKSAKGTKVGRSVREMLIFAIIGVIGLVISEICMFLGIEMLQVNYLFVKVAATSIVLLWNYSVRKILIFSKKI